MVLADKPASTHAVKTAPQRFRLVRYFTLASLVALAVAGSALYFLERSEETFFADVQRQQGEFFAKVQSEFARQQEAATRDDLLKVHEAAHVNLTRVLANTLWNSDFAPFVKRTQQFPVDNCRAIAARQDTQVPGNKAEQTRACLSGLGRRIVALPEFGVLDAKVHAMMRNSTVFKIKVYDLRGITVYSSEHAQIGEDKADNRGWQSAASGQIASELTHRDKFSAFEGVVENRDLISSYIPRMAPDGTEVIGVFEIYSDITPFLEQTRKASEIMRSLAASRQATVAEAATSNQKKVHDSADRFLFIMAGLLVLLFAGLFVIARNGQRIIDKQMIAQERSVQREQQWHREKMAALATMAANIAHEVGNPLATISALAENLANGDSNDKQSAKRAQSILEQADRIATMTRQIADFAAARSEASESVDVNQMITAICDFLNHAPRFRHTPIEFRPTADLPSRTLVPDFLNEVMMNLLQACDQIHGDGDTSPENILVETALRDDEVVLSIHHRPTLDDRASAALMATPDCRVDAAQRRVAEMGGSFSRSGCDVVITLPPCAPSAGDRGIQT